MLLLIGFRLSVGIFLKRDPSGRWINHSETRCGLLFNFEFKYRIAFPLIEIWHWFWRLEISSFWNTMLQIPFKFHQSSFKQSQFMNIIVFLCNLMPWIPFKLVPIIYCDFSTLLWNYDLEMDSGRCSKRCCDVFCWDSLRSSLISGPLIWKR